ncbi:MAG: hypothetical protein MUC81_04735 [Bacteroidia bacterium]|jgi:hypothetical protein|nr:hypothetical protein [Bacteroidia bacterium]
MRKYTIILSLFVALIAPFELFAQDDEDGAAKDKVEALRIAFITEKLNLSSKEAELFWPIFNSFQNELKGIRKKQRDASNAFKLKANPSEKECENFINEQLSFRQQETDLWKKYSTQFKKAIPAYKIAKLLSIEQEFKAQLLKRLKERRDK